MAIAAGHKFGQFIGEYCERAIEPLLQEFADKHSLFLDKKGPRPARPGRQLRWLDCYGNSHDLDYVLERGGNPARIGTPVAFIESAWRRYTKHSRNKAQEIQGAILPVADQHHFAAPMLGCILAGVYTTGALEQLRSVGFKVLYFGYDSVVAAFASVGVDVSFDESTPDADFDKKLRKWARVPQQKKLQVWEKLLDANQATVAEFLLHLESTVKRRIAAIRVMPLHGSARECHSVVDAIRFVETYDEVAPVGPFVKYEILIRYDNNDTIDAQFHEKVAAIEFLEAYHSGNWTPA